MKSFSLKLLCPALLVCLTAASCSANEDLSENAKMNPSANIVAGHGEPSFTENFGLKVDLPMDEAEFRFLLESGKIDFRLIDGSNPNEILPVPRHRQSNDVVKYRKMYEIYGGVGLDGRARKTFRAYVDANSMVVYIENAFSYTGP